MLSVFFSFSQFLGRGRLRIRGMSGALGGKDTTVRLIFITDTEF